MPPSKDYEKFSKSVVGDVSQASFAAKSLADKTAYTRIKLRESCNPDLIPSNSTVEIEQCPFSKLRFGDIVLMRDKKDIVIRRYVGFEVRGVSQIVLHVVNQKWKIAEEYKDGNLNGRIIWVSTESGHYNPYKKETIGQRIANRMNYFGTSTPLKRIASAFSTFSQMALMRQKK